MVELNETDALLFVEFQRHYEAITQLIRSGAMDTANGEVVLRFDHRGELREISKNALLYKRVKIAIVPE